MVLPYDKSDNAHMFSERSLKRCIDAEYDLIKSEIASATKEKHAQIQRSLLLRLTHDGTTLVSRKKV